MKNACRLLSVMRMQKIRKVVKQNRCQSSWPSFDHIEVKKSIGRSFALYTKIIFFTQHTPVTKIIEKANGEKHKHLSFRRTLFKYK